MRTMKAVLAGVSLVVCLTGMVGMGIGVAGLAGCSTIDRVRDVVGPVTNTPVVIPGPVDEPATNTAALPFDKAKCTFKRIDRGTLEWAETRTLTITKLTKHDVYSTCTGPDWPKRKDGLQGTWNVVVEQPDKTFVVASFDWNRAKHQPRKPLENFYGAEHAFLNIRTGCKLWFFTSASNRDAIRTVLERSSIEGPFIWQWDPPVPKSAMFRLFDALMEGWQ